MAIMAAAIVTQKPASKVVAVSSASLTCTINRPSPNTSTIDHASSPRARRKASGASPGSQRRRRAQRVRRIGMPITNRPRATASRSSPSRARRAFVRHRCTSFEDSNFTNHFSISRLTCSNGRAKIAIRLAARAVASKRPSGVRRLPWLTGLRIAPSRRATSQTESIDITIARVNTWIPQRESALARCCPVDSPPLRNSSCAAATNTPTMNTSSIDHFPSRCSHSSPFLRAALWLRSVRSHPRANSLPTGKTMENRNTTGARIQLPSSHRLSIPPQIE